MEGYLSILKDWRKSAACKRRPGIMFPRKSKSICINVRSWVRFARKTGSRENSVSGNRKSARTKDKATEIAPSQ